MVSRKGELNERERKISILDGTGGMEPLLHPKARNERKVIEDERQHDLCSKKRGP